jgi:hypothetical protein
MLLAVGVNSPDDLDRLGPVAVYVRLRRAFPGVNRNFLHVLEAIDAGCSWREVTPERKLQLDAEVAAAEQAERTEAEQAEEAGQAVGARRRPEMPGVTGNREGPAGVRRVCSRSRP